MHINDVSTAIKVGNLIPRNDDSNNNIKIEWLEEKNE